MSDASTMDPAILERVEKLWSLSMQGQAASIEDTYFLASTLRTALADTRRVDWLDRNLIDVCHMIVAEESGWYCMDRNALPVPNDGDIHPSWRQAVDAAMAATPRETT